MVSGPLSPFPHPASTPWEASCTPGFPPIVSRLGSGWDQPLTLLWAVCFCPASQEACDLGRRPRGWEFSFDKHLVRVASTAVKWE